MLFGPKFSGKLRVQQHQPVWDWMILDVREMRSHAARWEAYNYGKYTWIYTGVYSDILGSQSHTLTHFRHMNPIPYLSDIRKGAAKSRPPDGNGWNTSIKVSRHLRASQDQIQHGPHGWFIYLYIGSHCQNEMEHRMWYNMIQGNGHIPDIPSETLHKRFTNASQTQPWQWSCNMWNSRC